MAQSRRPKSYPLNAHLAGSNDDRASKSKLDQYYTRPEVAVHLYGIFREVFEPADYQMVEPSAGQGAFFKLLPPGALGFDIEPQYPGIATADFLTVELPTTRPVIIIGNPPFGKNASTAIRFVNHAARHSNVVAIAMILPRSFRKASIENRLDPAFHLVREETVPRDAFLHDGKPFNVSAVFQIWVRGAALRRRREVKTEHPDFEFTTKDRADFVVQRVGARAGRLHHNFNASPNSHYFIRGNVEGIMVQLDFATVAANATCNPSLAKAEIVSLYSSRTSEADEFLPAYAQHQQRRGLQSGQSIRAVVATAALHVTDNDSGMLAQRPVDATANGRIMVLAAQSDGTAANVATMCQRLTCRPRSTLRGS